ncbi:DUF2788 domain-containing protein [Pseudidiomarina sediminum]|uniref:DUF2788 domain-containing protein n=1 Tax=Pseudidiomarina sediminum TaxID=431675 RepID=A0A432Z412_9GAMM|nr:DUF2788 domain-containing protein [Pseudidiomarina sediminum]MBY6062845.1 DUF2788 domain-containing protein [Pseudidiomarina sediminum]RUO72648.1 DUF2788 domain-containing protein [Pseudidiomarina sediminum]
MLSEHFETIEVIGTNLAIAILFILIGLAIQDVLKKSQVPKFGRWFVWLVLFLGCAGFIAKGIIQVMWESGI